MTTLRCGQTFVINTTITVSILFISRYNIFCHQAKSWYYGNTKDYQRAYTKIWKSFVHERALKKRTFTWDEMRFDHMIGGGGV